MGIARLVFLTLLAGCTIRTETAQPTGQTRDHRAPPQQTSSPPEEPAEPAEQTTPLQPGTWTKGPPIPYGLGNGSTGVTLADGRVLIAGGFGRRAGDPRFTNRAALWNPATQSWSRAPDMSVARGAPSSILLPSGKAMVVGGRQDEHLTTVELFDPETERWSTAAPLSDARVNAALLLLADGRVLAVGGRSATGEIWDPASGSWTRTGPLNQPRRVDGATLLDDGRVLIVGGEANSRGGNCAFLASGELWDPATNRWTTISAMPRARAAAPAILLPSGKVLVVAGMRVKRPGEKTGYHCWGPLDDALVWDPATDSWSSAGRLSRPRSDHKAVRLRDGRVVVFGGTEGASVAEVYDERTGRWGDIGGPGARPYSHVFVRLADGGLFTAGGHRGTTATWTPER